MQIKTSKIIYFPVTSLFDNNHSTKSSVAMLQPLLTIILYYFKMLTLLSKQILLKL